MHHHETEQLRTLVLSHRSIVFFGGAGVSTESGIPDFRSADGLFRNGRIHAPEQLVSHDMLETDPALFFSFYRDHLVYPDAKPNPAHVALANLEREGRLAGVITQNIDGLHQAAGSRHVLELHGSIHRNHCLRCGRSHTLAHMMHAHGIPLCEVCGGPVRPDVVLYGEMLAPGVMRRAEQLVSNADLLLVGGTSLVVYPAAGLLHAFRGDALVLINRDPTSWDTQADLIIRTPIGETFAALALPTSPTRSPLETPQGEP